MKKWFLYQKKADFEQIGRKYGIHPVIARVIRNRDIEGDEQIYSYLCGTRKDCYDPRSMKNILSAAAILKEKAASGRKIRVIGDYDVDGVCATHILVRALRYLGADVDVAIPHRIRDGYGLNDRLIREAYDQGVDTILTCDNGIAAKEQIALAKQLGMTILVTDHHEVPYEEQGGERVYLLPPADAVVNPKQPKDCYPYSGICGAVVAWKLASVLLTQEDAIELEDEFIQIAALATVCDVMELKDENRIIVKEGLKCMAVHPIPGIRALLEVNGLRGNEISAYHLGFVLGPCLNATGRLDDANRALELLGQQDFGEAVRIADELKKLNSSRKEMTALGVEEAVKLVSEQERAGQIDKVLVLYLPQLHESLAGIVAGKIREIYMRPTFVLTDAQMQVKGSGRSVEGYDMYGELTRVQGLLLKYGGHRMAAGLSLEKDRIEEFREQLNSNCELLEADLIDKIYIDVAMPFHVISEELVNQLRILEPCGNGNSRPVFAQKGVRAFQLNVFGKNRNVCKCKLEDSEGTVMTGVLFGETEGFEHFVGERKSNTFSILYHPVLNEFRGRKELELVIDDYC